MTEELKTYVISVITTQSSEIFMQAGSSCEAMKAAKAYFKEHQVNGQPTMKTEEIFSCIVDNTDRVDKILDGSIH